MAAKLKKGDNVVVIAGRDKGKQGEIFQVFPKENRALVKGVNMVVRHTKQTQNQEGGRIKKEAKIDLSNLLYFDDKSKQGTRVGFKTVDNKKVRICKSNQQVIDEKTKSSTKKRG